MANVVLRAQGRQITARGLRDLALKIVFEPRVLSVATLAVLWVIGSQFIPAAIPPVEQMQKALARVARDNMLLPIFSTMHRLVLGWLSAMIVGLAIGVLMGSKAWWNAGLHDYVMLLLSLPGLVWAILAVVWFGDKIWATVVAVTIVCSPFVVVNIYEGVRNVDKELLDMSRAYGVDTRQMLRRVVVPSIMPFFVAAARIAFAHGWKATAIVEIFGGPSGISYEIQEWFGLVNIPAVLIWVGVFALLLLTIEYGIFAPVQKYLFRWRPDVGSVLSGGQSSAA